LIAGGLVLDGDERDWVPQSTTLSFKPLLLNVSQGYYINILRVRASRTRRSGRCSGDGDAVPVTGGYTYIDPYGTALGYEDVFTA
jgi:2,4'-dihydroxyacetophenone dioxygenase